MSIHASVCRRIDRPINSRPEGTGRVEARLAEVAGALVAGLAVCLLGLTDGGSAAPTWGWATLALVAVALITLLTFGVPQPTRLEYTFVGGLTALGAWALLSAAWSEDRAESILDAQRTLLYVAATIAILLVGRRATMPQLAGGLLAAITFICLYGLSLRLFPDSLASGGVPISTDPQAAFRLAQPLGYSNALGAVAAMGLALSLLLAARSPTAASPLAAAPSPLLAATLYLTFGRGAWLALAAGLAVAVAAAPRRLDLLTALLVLAAAPALTVLLTSHLDALTSRPASVGDVSDDGRLLAVALALLTLSAAAVALAFRHAAQRLRPSARALTASRVALVVVVVGLAAAVIAAMGSPVDLATRAYHGFNAPPAPREGDVGGRVLVFSGSSRSDYWRVAWDDVEDNPLLGSGAGSYQRRWLRHRPADLPVRDAHSLYLETLAELGPVGLLSLLAALGAPLAAAVRARGRPLVPAALAAYCCFLVHAGVDWDWEMPAVTVAGLSAGAVLLLGARRDDVRRPPAGRMLVAPVAAAGAVSVLVGLALIGNLALERSEDARDRGDTSAAEREARRAGRWAPWSSEPWRLLGEAQLTQGDLVSARASFRKGLAKDRRSWELWLDLALASEEADRKRALDRAEMLNPRAPEVDELRAEG
jgi:O-Antigen ligase